jgi:hypothetical protein
MAGTKACESCKQNQIFGGIHHELWKNMQSAEIVMKPPEELIPKEVHKQQRMDDIRAAIKRYMYSRQPIPIEWVKEYNEIVKQE